jgi:PAP2 superfamily
MMKLDPEAAFAWRIFSYNWLLVGLMACTLAFGMVVAGFSLKPTSAVIPLTLIAVYISATYYKAHKRDPVVIFILGSTGQLLLIPALMTPLTYVAASANLPLQDVALDAVDRAFGLDWMAYFNFIYSHHALLFAVVLAYSMIGWPVFGVPIVLGLARNYRRLQEFTLAFGIALAVTTIISSFVPAMGTYDLLHFVPDPNVYTPGSYLEQLRDLPLVRDGSLRHLDLANLTGIVTFPSFHAAAAVLYLWALWPVHWFRPIAVVANIAMLLATPLAGGHYFIDVLAGIGVSVGAIAAACCITNYLAKQAAQPWTRAVDEAIRGAA